MFFGDYLFVCRPCLVQFGTSYFLESTAKCPRQTALLRGKIILKEQCLMTYIQSRIWSFSILIIKHTDLIINESKVKTKCRLTTKRNIRNFICRSSVAWFWDSAGQKLCYLRAKITVECWAYLQADISIVLLRHKMVW